MGHHLMVLNKVDNRAIRISNINQPNQQNYTRTDDDPFSTGGGPIEVSDDDLPF